MGIFEGIMESTITAQTGIYPGKTETLHEKKIRAGQLGGIARTKNNSPGQLSDIGARGGRPRALNYSEKILQEQEKKNKRRNQQNSEHMECKNQSAALKKNWLEKRKEVILRS